MCKEKKVRDKKATEAIERDIIVISLDGIRENIADLSANIWEIRNALQEYTDAELSELEKSGNILGHMYEERMKRKAMKKT